jgi:hypothetical protein
LTFEIYRFTQDLPIFDREYGEGVVDVVPFLLSRRAAKALEDFLVSIKTQKTRPRNQSCISDLMQTALFYSLIIYYMVGLRPGASHFFVFFAIVILIQLTAVSVALFAVSIFREFSLAVMVGFAVFGYSNFGGGCFLPANKIPVYVNWVKWISYIVSLKEFWLFWTDRYSSMLMVPSITTNSPEECFLAKVKPLRALVASNTPETFSSVLLESRFKYGKRSLR